MTNYEGNALAYYKALANALKDGVIDQDEYSLLLSLREAFSVSNSLHEQMEREIRASLSSPSPVSPSDGPGMSTFAGQTTDKTVENYAKMMIDSINRGKLEDAIGVWGKSKEIDIETTNRIFEGRKYGKMIADAYLDHVVKDSIPSMLAWCVKMENEPVLIGTMANPLATFYAQQADREMQEAYNCLENSKVFHTNYIRHYQIKGWGEYEYGKDLSDPHFTGQMNKARDALNQALKMDPNDEYSINVLSKVNNRRAKPAPTAAGCFIATAAYGTPFAEEIDVLRNWRDDFLEASYPGRAFIKAYYSLSPPVADNISESEGKRKIVRTALGPIVRILKDRYSN